MIKQTAALALALFLAGGSFAAAETRKPAPKPLRAKTADEAPACARAAYKGDPVCFGADDSGDLPTPSGKAVRGASDREYRVNDTVSIRPSTDVKSSDKRLFHFNNANPNPRSQDVSGGAAVNYKF